MQRRQQGAPSALSPRRLAIAGALIALGHSPAARAETGTIPILTLGGFFGFANRPFVATNTFGDSPTTQRDSKLALLGGPHGLLRIDTGGKLLFYGEGLASLTSTRLYSGRAGVIIGPRFQGKYTLWSDSKPDSGGYVTRTTTTYLNKEMPYIVGLQAGGGLMSFGATSVEKLGTRQASEAPADSVPTVEAGFGLLGQYGLSALAFYDVKHGSLGFRGDIAMGFDFGPVSLTLGVNWYVVAAKRDETPATSMVLASLGLGTGMHLF